MTDSLRHAVIDTALCPLSLVADGENLIGLGFERSMTPAKPLPGRTVDDVSVDPLLSRVEAQLSEYLSGTRREFDIPLAVDADKFSEDAWMLLREIPYGETRTYGQLAEQLGNKAFAQRVGQVMGRNPIAIIVPCHRVIGADGQLVGFGGGLDRKRRLLDLEEPPDARAERLF